MESIKFGATNYELVANGYQMGDGGGKITFLPGDKTFLEVKAELKECKDIVMLDSTGKPIQTRTDMVYAGRLTEDDNYIVGVENTENGAHDVTGIVMIAEFRAPDLRDQIAALQAQVAYVAMMTDVEMEA